MKPKIVDTHKICLFCGEEMPQKYEEYTPYHECDCVDAVKDRKILAELYELNQKRPKHRYDLSSKLVLTKIENNE